MIKSRAYLRAYQKADRVARGCRRTVWARFFHVIWRYERCLRRLEYLPSTITNAVSVTIARFRHRRLGRLFGFSIPRNIFRPRTVHRPPRHDCGRFWRQSQSKLPPPVDRNIGTAAGQSEALTLGDNCYIRPGAKAFGPIEIGSATAIGANAVMNRGLPDGHVTLGEIPAKQISSRGSGDLLIVAVRCPTS